MVIQVYALTSNTEEAEVGKFYEDLQDLLELTAPKIKSDTVSPYISHEVVGPDAMIFVF